MIVLLRVEHLEQRRRRVSAVVAAKLVDLIEHHDGVHAAGDGQTVDDAAGHRADVRLAVAADLRLIVHAAEGDARELAVRGMGNAHGDARLARARRADQTQHAALDIGRELAHGQIFRDAVLDLFEAEMLIVEHFARGAHIEPFLGAGVPRHLEADVQIIADNGRLRRAERLLFEPVDFLEQALLGFLRQVQRLDLLPIGGALGVGVVRLAELCLNDLHLLAQQILLLRLVEPILRSLLKLMLQAEHTRLMQQHFRQQRKSAARPRLLKQLLLLLGTQKYVLRDKI